MRSVRVFPVLSWHEAQTVLETHGIDPDLEPLTSPPNRFVRLWSSFVAPPWDPDDPSWLTSIETFLGWRPEWAVEIFVSGRIDGREELGALVEDLLADGGCVECQDGRLIASGSGLNDLV